MGCFWVWVVFWVAEAGRVGGFRARRDQERVVGVDEVFGRRDEKGGVAFGQAVTCLKVNFHENFTRFFRVFLGVF
jgi:hypothetical protein